MPKKLCTIDEIVEDSKEVIGEIGKLPKPKVRIEDHDRLTNVQKYGRSFKAVFQTKAMVLVV